MLFLISTILRIVDIYSYILIGYALLSWVPPLYDTVLGRLLCWLVEPILAPFRRLKLQFFGIDWTILLVMVLFRVGTNALIYCLLLL